MSTKGISAYTGPPPDQIVDIPPNLDDKILTENIHFRSSKYFSRPGQHISVKKEKMNLNKNICII